MPACRETKKYSLNDLVTFKNDDDRMELDGDGIYIVIGLQSGVKLKSGWEQKERITLLCDNGVIETTADKIKHCARYETAEKNTEFEVV